MVSDGFVYEFMRLGLLWLCDLLPWMWPYDRIASGPPPSKPAPSSCQ